MAARRRDTPVSKEQLNAAYTRIDSHLATAGTSLARLEEREREYNELQTLLKELPEKVRHPIMVPYGPLAFFPGHLEHTNEVLTQLSSEYFVLRTTKNALGLLDRRRERLKKEKESVAKNQRDMQLMRGLTVGEETVVDGPGGATIRRDEQGFIDIREPYNEEDDAPAVLTAPSGATVLRDEQGFMDIREPYTEEEATLAPGGAGPAEGAANAATSGDADDLLARLRELERMEAEEEGGAAVEEPNEEMAELDRLMAQAEAGTLPEPDRQPDAATTRTEIKSPADIFSQMRSIDEIAGASKPQVEATAAHIGAAVASTSRAMPPSTEATSSGVVERSAGVGAYPSSAPSSGVMERSSGVTERSGRGFDGAGGVASGVLERSAVPLAPFASPVGRPEPRAPAQQPPATEEPPKRVSKFKADRQSARG